MISLMSWSEIRWNSRRNFQASISDLTSSARAFLSSFYWSEFILLLCSEYFFSDFWICYKIDQNEVWLFSYIPAQESLVFHYALDHRLDRVGFLADALEVLAAEPDATLSSSNFIIDWPELSSEIEVWAVHKLLVTRPHESLPLLTSFNRPDSVFVINKNLNHFGKVDIIVWADHCSSDFLLATLESFIIFDLDGNRFMVLVHLPVGLAFLPRIWTAIPEPPVVVECWGFVLWFLVTHLQFKFEFFNIGYMTVIFIYCNYNLL